MARIWIKLWTEALNDPKMGALPDRLYRRVIECIMLAGQIDRDGEIGTTAEIAWALRVNASDLERDLREIARVGIVKLTPDGWTVTKFSARQARIPDVERKRQERNRGRYEQYYGGDEDEVEPEADEAVTTEPTASSEWVPESEVVTNNGHKPSQECHTSVTKCDTEEKRREEKRREENRTDETRERIRAPGPLDLEPEKLKRSWMAYKEQLRGTLPKSSFDRYVYPLAEPVLQDNVIQFMANDIIRPWLIDNLKIKLEQHFSGATGRVVSVAFQ